MDARAARQRTARARGRRGVRITNLGDWGILKRMGEGGSSNVYVAENVRDSRKAAIKIIDKHEYAKEFMSDDEMMDAMETEASILHKLNGHPHIVELLAVEDDDDRFYGYVMPLGKRDLTSHMATFQGNRDPTTARMMGRQLICGIQYIHACGIVHNDIKLENCIIDMDGNLRVIDFGLSAFAVSKGEELVEYFGTRGYMAPEIVMQRGHGAEVDIWAYGVVLFVMFTGLFPFRDKSMGQLVADMTAQRYLTPQFNLTLGFAKVLKTIFTMEPSQRAPATMIMQHAWFQEEPAHGMLPDVVDAVMDDVVDDVVDAFGEADDGTQCGGSRRKMGVLQPLKTRATSAPPPDIQGHGQGHGSAERAARASRLERESLSSISKQFRDLELEQGLALFAARSSLCTVPHDIPRQPVLPGVGTGRGRLATSRGQDSAHPHIPHMRSLQLTRGKSKSLDDLSTLMSPEKSSILGLKSHAESMHDVRILPPPECDNGKGKGKEGSPGSRGSSHAYNLGSRLSLSPLLDSGPVSLVICVT